MAVSDGWRAMEMAKVAMKMEYQLDPPVGFDSVGIVNKASSPGNVKCLPIHQVGETRQGPWYFLRYLPNQFLPNLRYIGYQGPGLLDLDQWVQALESRDRLRQPHLCQDP